MARPNYVDVEDDDNIGSDSDQRAQDHFDDSENEDEREEGVQRMTISRNVVMPPNDAGVDAYRKALEAAQLSILEMKVELQKARKENVTLAENQPRRRLKAVPKEISLHDKTIKDLGRQYAIMISPWVDNSSFGHKGRPDVDPQSPDRFKDKLSQHKANIAEMYDFIPKDLHGLMEKHSHFADLFRAHVNAMRSTAAHSIREKSGQIFSMNGSWMSGEVDRSQIKELQDLIMVNGEYKQFPPILFPDASMRRPDIFRNEILAKTLRVLLFGPSSLKSIHIPRPKTNAEIWSVKEVTAGSIAFAAILSRFIASPDAEFSPKGNKTNIDYMADFNLYKRMLLVDSPRMRSLFDWYNERIFAKNNRKEVQNHPPSQESEEDFEELMRGIEDVVLDEEGLGEDERNEESQTGNTVTLPTGQVVPPPPGNQIQDDIELPQETVEPNTGRAQRTRVVKPRTVSTRSRT